MDCSSACLRRSSVKCFEVLGQGVIRWFVWKGERSLDFFSPPSFPRAASETSCCRATLPV